MEEEVYFYNSKGVKLCGILTKPKNKSKFIVVFVHGFRSHKDNPTAIALKNFLLEKNIHSFRFDLFGHGWSEGNFREITISQAVDDIISAVKFLSNKGYEKIGLVGSSFGGCASINAVPKIKNIVFLVLKSPVINYEEKTRQILSEQDIKEWQEKGFREMHIDKQEYVLNYSYYDDFKNNDGYKAGLKIKIPTLIIHGDLDKVVSVNQSIKLSKLIKNSKLVLIKGADHKYTSKKHFNQILRVIKDFILENSKKYV